VPTTPTWLAATSGQAGQAGQVNQFLGTHAATYLYAGTLQASQATAGAASVSTNGLYLAQKFTTGAAQTATGYVAIPLTTTTVSGASLAPTTVSLCADNAGAPGTVLVAATVTCEYANLASGGTATVFVIVPLPATGLTPATAYWITVAAAGNVSNSYTWYKSNQVTGASTSPDGTTWTTQSYGFEYKVYDQAVSGQLTCTWQDAGARWTAFTYSGLQTATLAEYTAGQTAAGYVQSYRTLTYSGTWLTGVA
jgi:hypothetical protein